MTGTPDDWTFRKSRFSADDKCVELACDQAGRLVAIRDSKNLEGPMLRDQGLQIGMLVTMLKATDVS
jgi:YD repeat-containing protein